MKTCKKCGSVIPWKLIVDGKRHHVARTRTFCFACSPFMCHNTKKLDLINTGHKKICECGREIVGRGAICYVCYQNKRTKRVRDKVHSIVGDGCWICGYNKGDVGRKVLDFHHMNRSTKKFNLTVRNMCNLSWDSVWPEVRKCTLICCRCHREIESGIIQTSEMEDKYKSKWAEIDARLAME